MDRGVVDEEEVKLRKAELQTGQTDTLTPRQAGVVPDRQI